MCKNQWANVDCKILHCAEKGNIICYIRAVLIMLAKGDERLADCKERPSLIYWEITGVCNHNCIHCFNYWRNDDNSEYSSCGTLDQQGMMEIVAKIIQVRPRRVVITGGEPLTAFARLCPAIDLIVAEKINVSINTNGALLTEEMAEYFRRNKVGLFVSFPSCVPEEFDRIVDRKGAFENVDKGLRIAKKYGLKFRTNTVVSRINVNSLYDTIKYIRDTYDTEFICATYVSRPINATDEFKEFMLDDDGFDIYVKECVRAGHELNVKIRAASHLSFCSFRNYRTFEQFAFKSACSAGKNSVVITESGDMRACARGDQIYGNILKEPFDEIWDRMAQWRDGSFVPPECKRCLVKKYCRGGCHIDNTYSPHPGKHIAMYSAPEKKLRVYYWTQRLLLRRWIKAACRDPLGIFGIKRRKKK